MYRDSIDAFQQVLSPAVRQVSSKSGCLQNGIEYCIVNVLLAGGDEFRIETYGQEARELCKAANDYSAALCPHQKVSK